MTIRRLAIVAALLGAGVLQLLLYRNARLHDLAVRAGDPAERIALLNRAERAFPWNDKVAFELGKAYAETAAEDLGDAKRRDAAYIASQRGFLRALRLNPGFTEGHLHLAEVILQMDYLGLPAAGTSFEEYKRAALLTGHNTRVYLDVALVLLGRWTTLLPDEREFTTDILRKALAGGEPERLQAVLPVWELNAGDYDLMAAVLPDDSRALRAYAAFLGERSLSLEARHAMLARSEALDFLRARDDIDQGRRQLEYYRIPEARERLTESRRRLESLVFYQGLAGTTGIPAEQYDRLLTDTYLLLGQCAVEETGAIDAALPELLGYLGRETMLQPLGDLERWLRERNLLAEKTGDDLGDLGRLAFDLTLGFKLNKYRETAEFGRRLESRFLAVPRDRAADFARVLTIIGDAFQKLDFLYESEAFHLRAREADPRNLDALLSLRKTYQRVNDEVKSRELDAAIRALLTPAETAFSPPSRLAKGVPFVFPLVSDGGRIEVRAAFETSAGDRPVLIAAVFNGRIVREDFAAGAPLVFTVDARPGANTLILTAVSGPASLGSLVLAPAAAD